MGIIYNPSDGKPPHLHVELEIDNFGENRPMMDNGKLRGYHAAWDLTILIQRSDGAYAGSTSKK
jgi:hypothetical protein